MMIVATVDGRCRCLACEQRTHDVYRVIGRCRNCRASGILMLFWMDDIARPLDCPICKCSRTVCPERPYFPYDGAPEDLGVEGQP